MTEKDALEIVLRAAKWKSDYHLDSLNENLKNNAKTIRAAIFKLRGEE